MTNSDCALFKLQGNRVCRRQFSRNWTRSLPLLGSDLSGTDILTNNKVWLRIVQVARKPGVVVNSLVTGPGRYRSSVQRLSGSALFLCCHLTRLGGDIKSCGGKQHGTQSQN